ncbi:hypothetical protein LWI29_006961 [Acer saccharum]|uniref:Integrase zinc-binding domain-containing protein n=1 Tax=Acer saccharum TaxID=4024 RepID=A0AA39RTI2_ACESA|nr:hypothetical protein LWI29_006961 [Acer saccharum]
MELMPTQTINLTNILLEDAVEARRIKYRSTRYIVLIGELYRRGFSKVLQRCVAGEETNKILKDVHSGVCENHTGGKSLAHKVLRQGFYWPILFAEAQWFTESCESCQRTANDIRQPPKLLRSLTSPWPFAMWGLDLIGPMSTGTKGGTKHAIVAVDYFSKWTEAVNKVIKHTLKAKLEAKKGSWVDKLPEVLWAYRTTVRSSTGETHFAMAFGTKVVIPAEITFTSHRVQLYSLEHNVNMLQQNLDELEEVRDVAQVRNTAYQQKAARYYNSHVRERRFQLKDLVLRRVSSNTKDKSAGSLADKWEGPYIIKGVTGHGAYMIARPKGSVIPRPCNAQYTLRFSTPKEPIHIFC